MYHTLRNLHKWIGLISCLFLMLIAASGFLLSLKREVAWIQPPTMDAAEGEINEYITMDEAAQLAFEVGIPELQSYSDIERMDLRPKDRIVKIRSHEGYHEVQIDMLTGEALSVDIRRDQFFEDIHDLSIFSSNVRKFVLPVVALALFALGLTGAIMFFVPVVRRRRYKKQSAKKKPS